MRVESRNTKQTNPMIITSDIKSDVEIKQTKVASTRVNIIYINRKNDVNHKILLNAKITITIY